MNTTKLTVLFIGLLMIISLTTSAAADNYRKLKEEYQGYDTPQFYKENLSISSEPSGEGGKEENLKKEEEKLKRIKERWKGIIRNISRDKGFFDFETVESKAIRRIAGREEIKKRLKEEINLNLLISVAFVRNPGLKAAKLKWQSSLEKYSQTTRLDNILRQYQSFINELDTKVGPPRHKQPLRNKFPFPGTLTLKGDLVEKEVSINRELYLIKLRDLITRLSESYDELLFVNDALIITVENLQLLKDLESTASIKYGTGATGFNDVIKAQIEISKMENDLAVLKERRKTIITQLNQLLDLPPDFPLGNPGRRILRELEITLKELYETGLQNQQELKLLQLKIEKTNLAITLAEKKFYPDFTLGLSYMEGQGTGGKGQESFRLKPMNKTPFWFGRNDAYVQEARLSYQELLKKLDSLKNRLFTEVRRIYFQLDKAGKDIRLYADSLKLRVKGTVEIEKIDPSALLAQAKKAIDVAQREYEAGKIDFLNVLDAQRRFLNFSLNYIRAIKDYNQNFSRLERVVGRRLRQ